MSLQTFQRLQTFVEPVLANYRDDLFEHDYHVLQLYDGPFIYGYRPTGTNMLLLRQHLEDYNWPRTITIDEIHTALQQDFIFIDYPGRNTHFLHFDGYKLFDASVEQLKDIWLDHVAKLTSEATCSYTKSW